MSEQQHFNIKCIMIHTGAMMSQMQWGHILLRYLSTQRSTLFMAAYSMAKGEEELTTCHTSRRIDGVMGRLDFLVGLQWLS